MTPKPHFPTIDDMINLPAPGEVQISPDGKQVVYTVSRPDWEGDERITQLWLVGDSPGQPVVAPRQLTFTPAGSRAPRWSPDGRWLAFISRRTADKPAQFFRISPFGGEAQQLGEIDGEPGFYAWSPDGAWIAFTMAPAEGPPEKQRHEKYGEYHVEDEDYQRAQLWLLEVETGKVQQITGRDQVHVTTFDWSPDGNQLALECWPSPDMKDLKCSGIYLLDLESRSLQLLVKSHASDPRWSPDGTRLACIMQSAEGMYANIQVCMLDLAGGQPEVLSADFDEDANLQAWRPDGIYFTAFQRVGSHLFRLDPATRQCRQVTPADRPAWFAWEYSFASTAPCAATAAMDANHPMEVIRLDLRDGSTERLTDFNRQVEDWSLGTKEIFQWTSQDGALIEGILNKPPDFDPAVPRPLLVVIHGGPSWLSLLGKLAGPERGFYPIQQWLQKGALVLEPNYRGSAGRGQAFRALNVRNLGVGDYWDVISGVDALIARGWADASRVGAMGWSQGGYISAFITTFSDRFKAVSVGAGISNWVTYYVNTDIHPFTRDYLQATPWDDMEIYRKTSPMTYIQTARTPTLIQHGDQDHRVPIPNAYELYQGLQDMGVEVQLHVYPGMAHSSSKPRTQRHIMESNYTWFNRWIWGEVPPLPQEKTIHVALAHGETDSSEDNLPAAERYRAGWIRERRLAAQREGEAFFLFSGAFGLVEPDFPTPPGEKALLPEEVSAMAVYLTETLRNEGAQRVIFYTPPAKQAPWALIYLGCLQVAAGIAGGITVEHQEVKEAAAGA